MFVKTYNKHDRIRHSLDRYHPKHDWVIEVPRGETQSNKHTRLRHVGVSRTGQGIARILERKKELKHGQ
jgi:hypothetical protein